MGTSTHLSPEDTVALQGTLDTFALPDVLRLLATTGKTGCVRVIGPRGTGAVWVDGGAVGTIEVPHAPLANEAVDGLFELLRFDEGSFTFETDQTPPVTGVTIEVEALIGAAEALLAEWREIESVVPSMDAFVTLRRELVTPKVSIDREQWVNVVAVGGGATVQQMSDTLALPELPVSRAVRDLVELGLVDIAVAAPAKHAARAPMVESTPGPSDSEDAASGEMLPADDALPVARPIRARRPRPTESTSAASSPETFVPLDLPGQGPAASYDRSVIEEADGEQPEQPEQPAESSPEDDELARQLATLSPRAADAVRAAAAATTDEERDAALDRATDGDDTANRGALLKFLSSVKT